ncbi:hypothetical protein [Burkholderia ambifaria]|nr:hypothetical protein [Burkholderia ambifaria]
MMKSDVAGRALVDADAGLLIPASRPIVRVIWRDSAERSRPLRI